jgi:hypothetical protein
MIALLPGLQEDVDKGLDHVVKLKKPRLLELVKYHFKDDWFCNLGLTWPLYGQ